MRVQRTALDLLMVNLVLAASLVAVLGLGAVALFRDRLTNLTPLVIVGVVVVVAMIIVPALAARYTVVADENSLTRSGVDHASVDWAEVTDVVRLPIRQARVAVVGAGLPTTRRWGEWGLAIAHGVPRNCLVIPADADLLAAIEQRSGHRVRSLTPA